MESEQRISAFDKLGTIIQKQITEMEAGSFDNELGLLIRKAYQKNQWFTPESIVTSLKAIASWLDKKTLNDWVAHYSFNNSEKRVGVIMAGNIPLVGFHDFLAVLMSGNNVDVKLSSDDDVLLPGLCKWLFEIEPAFSEMIRFVPKLEKPDAVIATGSNNSARYFEYYFGKYPNIIRKNRNSVAVLTGNESKEELHELGNDIFMYFGLGCRNVSKLYIPEGYDFNSFFPPMEGFSSLMQHNKYMNNHDYHNSIFLLNDVKFLTNNFLIVREHEALATPVAVLHYQYYKNAAELKALLEKEKENIQCIAGNNFIPFGKTQQPGLMDYADGVDVMKFLTELA